MKVVVGSATDIGQVREGNEDSLLIVEPLYAVADGMGGHRGGEVASTLALETVQQLFEQRQGSLADQVAEANRAVFERSRNDRSVSGMGTTLTAALVDGDRVHLAHVGDSRAYLFRGGELRLLTEDHTLVHKMVVEGEITAEEAETHPHRSILTRALGVDQSVIVDEGDIEVADGDRILLCSDGLTGMVTDGQIREILAEAAEPQGAVDRLVTVANRAGGIDNITAIVLDFSDDGSGPVGTETEKVPHQPTVERPVQQAAPPRRSDITIVGAPIPEPPPKDRAPGPMPASAPTRHPGRRGARKVGTGIGVTLGLLVLGVVGLRLYLDTQWFVGVSGGRVAIFRGVPAEVGGFELHSVVLETTIPAEDAQSLALYRGLSEGITADDREGADAIVEQIRQDVAQQPAS
jgi:PPM family protein phosphatase